MTFNSSSGNLTDIIYDGVHLTVLKYIVLPNTYQQVEYLESTGTQWIDTGYVVNNNSKIELGLMFGSNTTSAYTGIYNVLAVRLNYGYLGTGWLEFPTAFTQGVYYPNIVLSIDNGSGIISNNGITLVEKTVDVSSNTQTFPILATRQENEITRYSLGRVYSCKIWDNKKLVHDLIPCYRKSDNVLGMYDIEKGIFHTNAGTGTFIKGRDVLAVWAKPYTLVVNKGSNTSITVNRTSSPYQLASLGSVATGDVIYEGDVLTITPSASTGYNLSVFTINGKSYSGAQTITVSGNVSISVQATLARYKLKSNLGTGAGRLITRESSPLANAATGPLKFLADGDAIYYGDVLKISIVLSNSDYKLISSDVNGQPFTFGTWTVTGDVVITVITQEIVILFSGEATPYYCRAMDFDMDGYNEYVCAMYTAAGVSFLLDGGSYLISGYVLFADNNKATFTNWKSGTYLTLTHPSDSTRQFVLQEVAGAGLNGETIPAIYGTLSGTNTSNNLSSIIITKITN